MACRSTWLCWCIFRIRGRLHGRETHPIQIPVEYPPNRPSRLDPPFGAGTLPWQENCWKNISFPFRFHIWFPYSAVLSYITPAPGKLRLPFLCLFMCLFFIIFRMVFKLSLCFMLVACGVVSAKSRELSHQSYILHHLANLFKNHFRVQSRAGKAPLIHRKLFAL